MTAVRSTIRAGIGITATPQRPRGATSPPGEGLVDRGRRRCQEAGPPARVAGEGEGDTAWFRSSRSRRRVRQPQPPAAARAAGVSIQASRSFSAVHISSNMARILGSGSTAEVSGSCSTAW